MTSVSSVQPESFLIALHCIMNYVLWVFIYLLNIFWQAQTDFNSENTHLNLFSNTVSTSNQASCSEMSLCFWWALVNETLDRFRMLYYSFTECLFTSINSSPCFPAKNNDQADFISTSVYKSDECNFK